MARTAIQPVDMADPRPRYTHGWRVGNTVYVAGQLALDKDGKLVGPNDIGAQTRRVLENMRRILANNSDFAIDPTMERYGLTFNPEGYLKRI